jgi:endogenous inhibitor of DNA gyrase (YacG/DUF329 family)
MELAFVMVFCGLSAGIIGKIKGSSFVIWFLVGAALPIIGTIAALAYRWERDELRRECEECGNVVALSDQVCMRCGRDLDWPKEVFRPRPAR